MKRKLLIFVIVSILTSSIFMLVGCDLSSNDEDDGFYMPYTTSIDQTNIIIASDKYECTIESFSFILSNYSVKNVNSILISTDDLPMRNISSEGLFYTKTFNNDKSIDVDLGFVSLDIALRYFYPNNIPMEVSFKFNAYTKTNSRAIEFYEDKNCDKKITELTKEVNVVYLPNQLLQDTISIRFTMTAKKNFLN